MCIRDRYLGSLFSCLLLSSTACFILNTDKYCWTKYPLIPVFQLLCITDVLRKEITFEQELSDINSMTRMKHIGYYAKPYSEQLTKANYIQI